jgi:hypothetical protein
MEFTSSDKVYAKVNSLLFSYGNAGLLDEGDYYDWTKNVLVRLNIPSFTEKEIILEVRNNKAVVPDDFYMLWSLWRCNRCNSSSNTENRIEFQSSYSFYQQDLTYNKGVVDCKTVITPTEENIIRRNVYFQDNTQNYEDSWCDVKLMSARNINREIVAKDCPNFYSKLEHHFSINDKEIYCNFKEGYLVLQYYALEKDADGLPMIPIIPHVEDAVEAYIIYRVMQKMWYNNIGDVERMYRGAETDYLKRFREASDYINLPTYASMIKMAYSTHRKYSKFLLPESRPARGIGWFYPTQRRYNKIQ